MSEMWQVPDDLADRVAAGDYREAWGREIERTAEVRAILTDLIAELRKRHRQVACPCDSNCGFAFDTCECGDEWPCEETYDLDRAEARLREVSGDE